MANNKYTLADLTKAVSHVLGGAPDQNITASQIVNGAISDFANRHPWRWRQRALNQASVNGQTYIALPTDFAEVVSIRKGADTSGCVEPTTIDRIVELRATTGTLTYGSFAWCLDYLSQADVASEPLPIIQLYPTPGASTAGYLVGTYLCQIPKLSATTDVPNIPSQYHELLLIWCRAYAQLQETGQDSTDLQLFEQKLPRYIEMDSRAAGYTSRMRGGMAQGGVGSGVKGPITMG